SAERARSSRRACGNRGAVVATRTGAPAPARPHVAARQAATSGTGRLTTSTYAHGHGLSSWRPLTGPSLAAGAETLHAVRLLRCQNGIRFGNMVKRLLRLHPRRSCLLLGPRQTGKSTLVRASLPGKVWSVDLLEHDTFLRFAKEP